MATNFSRTVTILPVLLLLLATVTSQQEFSFLEQLQRQQNIQLEQQELQGQLQDLAIRIQSAKDLRNMERVVLLEGARDRLLAKFQDLQDQLQASLHGAIPRRPQTEQKREDIPEQKQTTLGPLTTFQDQQILQSTQLPQQTQDDQKTENLEQEDDFQQNQQQDFQELEEVKKQVKNEKKNETLQPKEIQKVTASTDDQFQTRQPEGQIRIQQVTTPINLPSNSSSSDNITVITQGERTLQESRGGQQRRQFQGLQLFGRENPFINQPSLVPQSFDRVFQSFGGTTQSFGRFPESFARAPQSFVHTFQSLSRPSQSFGQATQSFGQPFQSFGQASESFGQASQSFGQASESFSQASQTFGQQQQPFGQTSQSFDQQPPFLQEVAQFFEPLTPITSFEVVQQPVEIQVAVINTPKPCTTTQGGAGACRPLVQCLTFYVDLSALRQTPCRLGTGIDGSEQLGVCCPIKGEAEIHVGPPLDRRDQGVLLPPPPPQVTIPPFTPQQLSSAANEALKRLQERIRATSFIISQGVFIPPVDKTPSPTGKHQERFFAITPGGGTILKAEQGQKGVEASVSLVEEFKLTPDQGTFALPTFSILSTIIADTCPRRPQCPGLDAGLRLTKYRTADGSCNNLRNGEWGSSNVALQRILPPKYGDGVNSPRVSDGVSAAAASREDGADGLPGARVVSSQFAAASSPNTHSSQEHTLILMQWGQFLDHDLTHTPISRGSNQAGISCCIDRKAIPPSSNVRHPDCYPIIIPKGDPFFGKFQEECMEFVRSLPAPRPTCNFGPREQMNQVTGYLDASNVYGSSSETERALRELSGGRLRVQPSNPSKDSTQQFQRDKGLLPGNRAECTDDFDEKECFAAGDVRANEQPELALMHTLWVREHNRIAAALRTLHPDWSDEALYQESRRIVAAEMQHITYNEFLPLILGNDYMKKFELRPLVTKGGNHTNLYDADLNAGITNVFATAAFRFGHSLVQGNILGISKFGTVKKSLQLSKNQFLPFSLYEEGAVDDFVRGLSTQTCQRFDRFFTRELTNHLFQGDLPFGLDLVALNIQRGRDHGLAPYADWREVCGFKKPTRWEDLLEVMDRETIEVLRGVYSTVGEIDLFVGGIGERGGLGGSSSLLGPTFVCLIGDQFARLRRGDRFYYEEGGQPSSFTQRQLEQLRKTSLARILCDNSDDVAVMQPLAFVKASFLNQRVPCNSESIPRVDLRAWADEVPAVA